MELLMNDELFIEKNSNYKGAKKRKSVPVHTNAFVYKLENMQLVPFDENYPVDFGRFRVKLFSLETLSFIISIVEQKVKKGIHRSFIFFSQDVIFMSDNLTISMLEYVVCYYNKKYGINVYVTYGEISSNQLTFGLEKPDMYVHNGFYTLESSIGFIQNSFLINWFPGINEISEDDFYCNHDGSKRCKMYIDTGPWDASIAISKCTEFLEKINVGNRAISAVCDVVGELAPNAVEHGKSDCIIDFCYVNAKTPEDDDETNISIIIYNFSEKLLWTDLYKKIFVENDCITHKKDRIDTIRHAWENHQQSFSDLYDKDDFYNLMAFQKVSGRLGDRSDGGLGINTLVQNVQKYSTVDYCYVLSGNGALRMDKRFIVPDGQDYIAFNENRRYVEEIPDKDAVMKTRFFMTGVAYNLSFYFKEEV